MKSLTGGGEMVTGIEIATEIGTNVVAGEWTMIKTVTTLVVIGEYFVINYFFLSYFKLTFDNTRTSQSNGDILLVIEIPDTEVEVDREKDIIGMKIIIDVIIEIKVSTMI